MTPEQAERLAILLDRHAFDLPKRAAFQGKCDEVHESVATLHELAKVLRGYAEEL